MAESVAIISQEYFLHLQLPDDEWETYGKGQHLRGADAAFADQVLDELVSPDYHYCTIPKAPHYCEVLSPVISAFAGDLPAFILTLVL